MKPSRKPTNQPTQQPTVSPTGDFVGVVVGASLVVGDVHVEEGAVEGESGGDLRRNRRLARAGSMLLMEVSDQAIVATITKLLDLPDESVEIVSESILSNVTNVATVLVEFKILAPAHDYPVTGKHFSSFDECFAYFSGRLSEAVELGHVHDQLVVVAEDMGAYELYSITTVNITSFENQGVVDTAVPDRDDISEGDFAGVVIGIVVAFLVLLLAVYCICGSGSGGAVDAQQQQQSTGEVQKPSLAEATSKV